MRVETPDIYADLQSKLVNAAFVPGEKLKPAELQGTYGCSANTIREVLLRLSNVGLVEFESQRGFRAVRASKEACNDITRFRILLEQEGAGASMRKGGLKWQADLAAAHHALVHIEHDISREGELQTNLELWAEGEEPRLLFPNAHFVVGRRAFERALADHTSPKRSRCENR